MVFVLVEGSVVIWVGGSSSSSSSAQFVRVLRKLEEGFFRIERYAVVAAIVVGEYVFVCLMVGKKFSRCFSLIEQLDCDFDWPKIVLPTSSTPQRSNSVYYSVQSPLSSRHSLSPSWLAFFLFSAPSNLPLILPASHQTPSPAQPLFSAVTHL